MSTRTLYFPAATAMRLDRLRDALGVDVPLSRIVAHAAALAVPRAIAYPDERPWDLDKPEGGRAARHTIYLADDTTERLEQLRGVFVERAETAGRVPTISVVVARALALAEADLIRFTRDDLELLRIEAEAEDLGERLEKYADAWGEDAIEELLAHMRANAELVTSAGRVHERVRRARIAPQPFAAAYVASSELMYGPLMRQSKRIIELITRARSETDLATSGV